MKRILVVLVVAAGFAFTLPQARAASQDECAIWLCLPSGFVYPECGDARVAMFKRLAEFKNPLPKFDSCQEEGAEPSGITFKESLSALMGPYVDASYVYYPERRIVPGPCNHRDSGPEEPRGCITTLGTIRIFQNGVQLGETYYRNTSGRDYTEDPVTGQIYQITDTGEKIPVIDEGRSERIPDHSGR